MTPKQQAFCDYYVASGNATEAAKKAGYSAKTAYSSGQRLLKNVETQKYLEEHARRAHNSRIADADEVLAYLSETMRCEAESRRERTKAAELLSKVLGIDRQPSERESGVKAARAAAYVLMCFWHDSRAGENGQVIVKKGAPGCGKSLSAIHEGLKAAARRWEQLQEEYYLLKRHFAHWKTPKGAWDRQYLTAHRLREDRVREVLDAYAFYTAHTEHIPCFFCNIEVKQEGRRSYPFTYEYVMQKRRLPYLAVLVVDEVGNSFGVEWSRAATSPRSPLHQDALMISKFFRWIRHFGIMAILTEQDDQNIFINIRRVVQYNEFMERCQRVCAPHALIGVYRFCIRRAIKGKLKDKYGKPLKRLATLIGRIGFLRFSSRLDGNTENNTVQLRAQRSSGYYIPVKLGFQYDTRYFSFKYAAPDTVADAFEFARAEMAAGRQEYEESYLIGDIERLVDTLLTRKKWSQQAKAGVARAEFRDKLINRAAVDSLLFSLFERIIKDELKDEEDAENL